MKTGILLLNLGGPETLDEVRPFLFRLFRDPDIIPLPKWLRWLSWPIAWLIAKFRAPKSRQAYAAIGGGSPLRRTNDAVAQKLIAKLKAEGLADSIAVAMRYWHPLTDAALDVLENAGCERVVCLPMYPHYSTTTTMSSYRALQKELAKRRKRWRPQLLQVFDYHLDERYLECLRARMRPLLAPLAETPGQATILFSAHSIPMDRVRESGDPYPGQIEAMAAALGQLAPSGVRCDLAYQSRVGPVEWLGPEMPQKIQELAVAGIKRLLVVPVSFVSEHVETLEEIDQEYAHMAAELGVTHFLRASTVQADDDFVDFLAALTRETLAGAKPGPCRRAHANLPCVCRAAA